MYRVMRQYPLILNSLLLQIKEEDMSIGFKRKRDAASLVITYSNYDKDSRSITK